MNIAETIDAFRRGQFEIDCRKLVLMQNKAGGTKFEGPGYIRQSVERHLTFKLYIVTHENTDAFRHMHELLSGTPIGRLHGDETYYDFTAVAHDGTTWEAKRVRPVLNWDTCNDSALATGHLQSITALLERAPSEHFIRLHFFEEYNVPLRLMSETEEHGMPVAMRDRHEFEACGCKFEVRKREGSGDTVIEATSASEFPKAFCLRIQEALQYLTGQSAFWRARVENVQGKLAVELASPWRRSSRSQLNPPITPASMDHYTHGWALFSCYLAYVTAKTGDIHWNPVAYHLYNAAESSSNSVDAWAIGVSVAVEAVASLVSLEGDPIEAERMSRFQQRMGDFASAQTDFADLIPRMTGLINSIPNRRPQDVLYALADSGRVERKYISAWSDLRNRHVHPKLKDLRRPTPVEYQELLDKIHRTEVLLRQLTFRLIGYEGPFTDYGAENWPSKNYPLAAASDHEADRSVPPQPSTSVWVSLTRRARSAFRKFLHWCCGLVGF